MPAREDTYVAPAAASLWHCAALAPAPWTTVEWTRPAVLGDEGSAAAALLDVSPDHRVDRLAFAGGEHHVCYSTDLAAHLRGLRAGDDSRLSRLLADQEPRVTVLHRCSTESLARYYEQRAIVSAHLAPTAALMLTAHTVEPPAPPRAD